MALNISRLFKRTPEVAAGDVNGDGSVDARDAASGQRSEPSGIMQDYYAHSNATATDRLPGNLEYPNVVTDNNDPDGLYRGINDQTPADWNERSAAPGNHIQEDVTEIVLNARGGPNALGAGFSLSDDLLNEARVSHGGLGPNHPGALGVKWEGPDFDATKNSLISEVGFPKLDGSDKSFTSAEGRSMSFELLKSDDPGSGANERLAHPGHPGHGLRDMEIDLGHGGTLNHDDGPDTEALQNIIQKQPGSYTATDDLWPTRAAAVAGTSQDLSPNEGWAGVGAEADFGAGARTMGPGQDQTGNFEIQDLIAKRGGSYTATDDLWKVRGEAKAPTSSGDQPELQVHDGTAKSGYQALPEMDANAESLSSEHGGMDTTDESPQFDEADALFGRVRDGGSGFQYNPKELGVEQLAALSGTQDGSGTDNANRMAGPGHAGSGFMMQDGELYPRGIKVDTEVTNFKSTSGMDPETEVVERSGAPTHARAEGILPYVEQSNLREAGPDAGGGFEHRAHTAHGAAGFLPEVDDEVLVGFSALDADADAPTTLVDLHSHAANADGLVGHIEIPHVDPVHHDIGGHHGHGFMDYTDDAVIDN